MNYPKFGFAVLLIQKQTLLQFCLNFTYHCLSFQWKQYMISADNVSKLQQRSKNVQRSQRSIRRLTFFVLFFKHLKISVINSNSAWSNKLPTIKQSQTPTIRIPNMLMSYNERRSYKRGSVLAHIYTLYIISIMIS